MSGPYVPNPNDPTRPYNTDEVQYGAEEIRDIKTKLNGVFTSKKVTATTYTILSSDRGNMVEMVNGGTVTIPSGIGASIIGITGTGQVAVVAGAGATLEYPASLQPKGYESKAFMTLTWQEANRWLLSGNLALAAI